MSSFSKIRVVTGYFSVFLLFILVRCEIRLWQKKPLAVQELVFYVQPFDEVTVYLNERKIRPKIEKFEKSRSLMRLSLEGQERWRVRVEKVGYKSIVHELEERDYRILARGEPLYWQLLPERVPIRFVGAFTVCHKPKSVNFLDESKVLVVCLEDKEIHIVDIRTALRWPLLLPDKVANQKGFVESLILAQRGEFYVSQMTTASVHVFSLSDFQYLERIATGGKWTKVLHYDPYRHYLYASNWLSKDISVIDLERRLEIRRVPTGGVPRGLALSLDGQELAVALFGQKTDTDNEGGLGILELSTFKWHKRYLGLGAMRHIVAYSDNSYYISDMAAGYIWEYKGQKLVRKAKTCSKPNTIVLHKERHWLFVSCRGPNHPESYLRSGFEFGRLQIFELPELKFLAEWEGGEQPTGLALSPSGKVLVSSDFLDDRIRIYALEDSTKP